MVGSAETSLSAQEVDPLLKDLTERKQSFRRNVVSLAAELKDVRGRLALQEESFVRETLTRQAAEAKVRDMEVEICQLKRCLEERNEQLQVSNSNTEQYLKELDDLKLQLSAAQATTDGNTAFAQHAHECWAMLIELDGKSCLLRDCKDSVTTLGEHSDHLQQDLQARATSQKQAKDDILRAEQEIMLAVFKAYEDWELRELLKEVVLKGSYKIKKHLTAKDEEITRLRDDIKAISAHWKQKTKELESQLEKHRKTDQELKKWILKLEFCLEEAQCQMWKLQRAGEKGDKDLKELRDLLAMKQQMRGSNTKRQNFWDSFGFIGISISMLALVLFLKR